MGIKYLNRFLKENAGKSMKFISIAELSGKKIAIDISIYIYKFISEDSLIENIYLMLSIFRHYNITPIFIFDGKPPKEKKQLLIKRRQDKKEAEQEYNNLKSILNNGNVIDDSEKQDIINNMDMLKRKFITVSKNDIECVKNLIRFYGATYFDAHGEADELCAMLTVKNKVWACLSEDMDMFVYGCPRVIRYISLLNHTAVLYNTQDILDNLGVTQQELREICILSGTDYNNVNNDDSINLYTTLKYFKKYHKDIGEDRYKNGFYEWLNKHTDYIKDYELLKRINKMFDLTENCNIKLFENIVISNSAILKNEIHNILKNDGFVFPI